MIISTSLVMFRPSARGLDETRLLSSQTHIGHELMARHGREWWLKQLAGWIKLWAIWKQKEGYSDMIAAKKSTLASCYTAQYLAWGRAYNVWG